MRSAREGFLPGIEAEMIAGSTVMTPIELRTKVGADGVLSLNVPVGMTEANKDVKVVVESVEPGPKKASEMTREEWHQFIAETAGSITDPSVQTSGSRGL